MVNILPYFLCGGWIDGATDDALWGEKSVHFLPVIFEITDGDISLSI